MTNISIMQPTFIPWLGYFALIGSVEKFIFLDDVQFSKQSWQSRNFIKTKSGKQLVSLDISKSSKKQIINEVQIADRGCKSKIRKTIKYSLSKAPYFNVIENIIEECFASSGTSLNDLNSTLIKKICKVSGISTQFFFSSKVSSKSADKQTRLIEICRHFGAKTYISPIGAYEYIKNGNQFSESEIDLFFFNYRHPVYTQLYEPFLSHLSAIDALAHVGPKQFKELAMSGCSPPLLIEQIKDDTHDSI